MISRGLRALTNLQYLELAATRVTDAGIAELKKLKSLRTLKLHATAITDAGVAELQRVLPKLKVQR